MLWRVYLLAVAYFFLYYVTFFWILEYDTLDLEGWNSLMFLLSLNFTSCKSAADLPRCVGGAILFLSV